MNGLSQPGCAYGNIVTRENLVEYVAVRILRVKVAPPELPAALDCLVNDLFRNVEHFVEVQVIATGPEYFADVGTVCTEQVDLIPEQFKTGYFLFPVDGLGAPNAVRRLFKSSYRVVLKEL